MRGAWAHFNGSLGCNLFGEAVRIAAEEHEGGCCTAACQHPAGCPGVGRSAGWSGLVSACRQAVP